MIVSWEWLKEYVDLPDSVEELERRLMMAGLNHESTASVGDDWAVDLEVTSNRPDCLGHIGVAREIAVLWSKVLRLPPANPPAGATLVDELASVEIECPQLCTRYTARVIRGVKVGPSPSWLQSRLATLGVAAINNVVDITNYVLFECGQPLHAFDLTGLKSQSIVVREPRKGEKLEAINHKTYELASGMCVIADAERPVGLGGVMGGADTEVGAATTDLLIEAAEFDPVPIRATARLLNLHSDSSYRFERGIDPAGVDWASRRCCELILDLAGGELANGVIDVGGKPPERESVSLRFDQLPRILGIGVPPAEVERILSALGNKVEKKTKQKITVKPPTWRRDLTREIDLIEEVARVHGYEEIPEDVSVSMAPSARRRSDEVLATIRHVLTACGFDEAMTISVVGDDLSDAFTPWTDVPALRTSAPIIRGAHCLRRSLVPSLLAARRENERLSNPIAELFEIAKVYLPQAKGLPDERVMLTLVSGDGVSRVKGVLETALAELRVSHPLGVADQSLPISAAGAKLSLDGRDWGYLGEIDGNGKKLFELRSDVAFAEVAVAPLIDHAELVPQFVELSTFPSVSRDVNLVVDESVRWADVESVVRASADKHLESLAFVDVYRDPKRLGTGKKSLLFAVNFRSPAETLTNEQVDSFRDRIVAACQKQCGGELRA